MISGGGFEWWEKSIRLGVGGEKKKSGREFLRGRSKKSRGGEQKKKGIGRKEKREERANKKRG